MLQPTGRSVSVHGSTPLVEQDRPGNPVSNGSVDGPADRWRQRDQDDLAALTAHAQNAVTVFLAEVGDGRSTGFKDPKTEETEHSHHGEVRRIGRGSSRSDDRLEL